jgi:ABC-2 type transport system permease protein
MGLGVRPASILGMLLTIVFMIVIAFTAVGFGLAVASKMSDFQGFQIIMNLVILPLFFLSTAFFPIATNENIPQAIVYLSFVNPLFFMVDGIRGSLTGVNNAIHPLVDLAIVFGLCIFMMGIGSYLFGKSEV